MLQCQVVELRLKKKCILFGFNSNRIRARRPKDKAHATAQPRLQSQYGILKPSGLCLNFVSLVPESPKTSALSVAVYTWASKGLQYSICIYTYICIHHGCMCFGLQGGYSLQCTNF